jgi:hypothetical protein
VCAGFLRSPRRLLTCGVPEGASVVLERGEPVADLVEPAAYVGHGQRRPVGEVTLGGWAVSREVPQSQLGEGLIAVEGP